MTNSGISIIVTSRNCSDHLKTLLASLEVSRKTLDVPCEVIIVDDSTNQKEQRDTVSICKEYDATLLIGSPHVGGKRNQGAESARYPVLFFIDSDCIAGPDLLQQHLCFHKDQQPAACLGLVEFTGSASWLWRSIELTPYLIPFGFALHHKTINWGPTANFSVSREAFCEIGGFDTTFPPRPGGEDVDLGLRLTKAGITIHCNPKAVVQHTRETWNTLKAMQRRLGAWGRAECYLMERHPDYLRPAFPRFTVVFSIMVAITLTLSVLKAEPWLLLGPILWLMLYLATTSTAFSFRFAKGWRDLSAQLVSQYLLIIFELSAVREFIRHRRLGFLFTQMIYTSGQVIGEWAYGSIRLWAFLIATSGLTLFFLLINR